MTLPPASLIVVTIPSLFIFITLTLATSCSPADHSIVAGFIMPSSRFSLDVSVVASADVGVEKSASRAVCATSASGSATGVESLHPILLGA